MDYVFPDSEVTLETTSGGRLVLHIGSNKARLVAVDAVNLALTILNHYAPRISDGMVALANTKKAGV